jgi:hypothetical protein
MNTENLASKFLIESLEKESNFWNNPITDCITITIEVGKYKEIIEKAIEIEAAQIENAFNQGSMADWWMNGKQYYTNNYGES